MFIFKKALFELERCYSVTHTIIDDDLKFLFASEGLNSCFMISSKDYSKTSVWENKGGTMSIIFLPEKYKEFLAIQNFLPTFQAEDAIIVWAKFNESSKWEFKTILKLPYVHRFDILIGVDNTKYFFAATLCSAKKDKDDWSSPGKIYAGVLPDNLDDPIELTILKDGFTKNHGYSKIKWNGKNAGAISCEEGVFVFTPPEEKNLNWKCEKILDKAVSDIALIDIDEDGMDELVTIEGFHGGHFKIYKLVDCNYEEVYQYPFIRDFGHVVWGGILRGKPIIIGAFRRPVSDFFYIRCKSKDPLDFEYVTIDTIGGPSNIDVVCGKDMDIIAVCNREIGEASFYYVTDFEN